MICTIHLSCDEQTCVKRLLDRGQSSGRADDAEEVIKKRFNVFYSESMPVVDNLRQMAPLIDVDSAQSSNSVTECITKEINNLLKF